MAQANHEAIGLLMRKEDQGVLVDIIITLQGIPIGEHTTTPIYPLSGILRTSLGWMNYEEKLTKSNLLSFIVSSRRMKILRHDC
jgi:hypothetical protein